MSESATVLVSSVLNGSREWLNAAVAFGITVDDFTNNEQREIWRAVAKLIESNKSVRLGSVETLLHDNHDAKQAAQNLFERGASYQDPKFHCEQILVARYRFSVKSALADSSVSLGAAETIEDIKSKIRATASRLDCIASNLSAETADNTFLPVYDRTIAEMESQLEASRVGVKPWVTTGLPKFDALLGGGWQKPGAYVISAMSGRGKTHLGIHLSLKAALSGAAVGYFTVEMPQSQIMKRMMAHLAAVPSSRINSVEHLTDEQFDRLGAIRQMIGHNKIVIEDSFRADLDKLVALIRKYKRANMLDVAVVDYIQQIVPSRRAQTKQQDMMEVAHVLKQVCLQEGIVMIQLAQAGRSAELAEKAGERLNATHIEHSHAIYQNADAVCFFQSVPGEHPSDPREEIIYVAKNRHGDTNKAISVAMNYETSFIRECE